MKYYVFISNDYLYFVMRGSFSRDNNNSGSHFLLP